MKVQDLKGPLLAYWFARASGAGKMVRLQGEPDAYTACEIESYTSDFDGLHVIWIDYVPYEDQAQLFELMNQNDFYVAPQHKSAGKGFEKGPRAYEASYGPGGRYEGPTLGEALCKAKIANVFGHEVPDTI
jgi:hypothetical protein